MPWNLLASLDTTAIIIIVVFGVLALVSVLYGVFRKFIRMAWTSWQILCIFALSLILPLLPLPDDVWGFVIAAGYLFGTTAFVLLIGKIVRGCMLGKKTQANLFFRICNRVLGAITALLNWVMLVVVLGGAGLAAVYYVAPELVSDIGILDTVYANSIWTDFFAKYALDLLLISVCVFFVRGGYRIGLARSIETVLVLALTLVAILAAMYLTIIVPFLRSLLSLIANSIAGTGLNMIIATLIAYFVTVLIVFVVFFIVIVLIGVLLNWLVRKYRSVRVLGVIDGAILSVVFFALFLVLACAFNFAVTLIMNGGLTDLLTNLPEMMQGVSGSLESIQEIMKPFADFFTSSPLSKIFYQLNPLSFIPLG